MATRDLERGPVAERVSQNLARLRNEQDMTLGRLSERLAELGRPISISGLSKIERGERRVDVDDLLALAVALDVSPNRLLLPSPSQASEKQPDVALTPNERVAWDQAWLWATGARALRSVDLHGEWKAQNRPHDEPLQAEDFEAMARAIDAGVAALERARAAGFATGNDSLAHLFLHGGLTALRSSDTSRG
ncbi:helix-turn-helix domain-containing protein [Geodermatophilus sp. SYSU D01105]